MKVYPDGTPVTRADEGALWKPCFGETTILKKTWCVYILSSLTGTLYVGMTDDLRHRIIQHKKGLFDGFTRRYEVNRLMYYEVFDSLASAARREKQMKKYRREKKIELFTSTNPSWEDLTKQIFGYLT